MLPKTSSCLESVDPQALPPRLLVASLMQLPMMPTAERHGELIADLKTDCPWLRKAQMVWIGRLPPADQARFCSHELQVRLVAQALGFGDSELAFVDFGWRQDGRRRHEG